jgi:hypothetical protein
MNPQSHSSTSDLVVSALEAIAGSLRALEVVSASLAEERGKRELERKDQVDTAIDLLRAAVSELRQSDYDEPPGAPGFIMAVRRRRRGRRRPLPPAE